MPSSDVDVSVLNEEFSAFIRGKIVAVCEAVLNEEIGVIAGSRRLKSLGFELRFDHDSDVNYWAVIWGTDGHLNNLGCSQG